MMAAVQMSQMEKRNWRAQPSAFATVQQAELAAASPSAVTAVPASSVVIAVPAAKPKVPVVQAAISAAAAAAVVKVNAPIQHCIQQVSITCVGLCSEAWRL